MMSMTKMKDVPNGPVTCKKRWHLKNDTRATSRSLHEHPKEEDLFLSDDDDDCNQIARVPSEASLKGSTHSHQKGLLRRKIVVHKGLIIALVSCVFQALGSMGVKMLAGRIPSSVIVFYRMFGYFLCASVCLMYINVSPKITLKQLPWLFLRIVIGTCAMCLSFVAYQNIPVADTVAILFSSPIFTGFLAWIILGERLHLMDAFLAILAFAGIILIARPSFIFGNQTSAQGNGNTLLGVLSAVVGAICVSIVFVLIRKLGGIKVHCFVQVWYYGVLGMFLTAVASTIMGFWVLPRCGSDRVVLIFIAVFGFLSSSLMTLALQLENAAYVAMMKTNVVIMSFVLEFALFGTVPVWLSVVGASLVLASSLGVTITKWKYAQKERKEEDAGNNEESAGENEGSGERVGTSGS